MIGSSKDKGTDKGKKKKKKAASKNTKKTRITKMHPKRTMKMYQKRRMTCQSAMMMTTHQLTMELIIAKKKIMLSKDLRGIKLEERREENRMCSY